MLWNSGEAYPPKVCTLMLLYDATLVNDSL